VELVAGAAAALLAVTVGGLDRAAVADELRLVVPVVAFLAALLVVAEVCAREGVFAFAALRLARRHSGGRGLVPATIGLAAVTTVLLNLDATVVLLTPLLVAAWAVHGRTARVPALVGARLANSASSLLPVSNLTNLVALPFLSLGFLQFGAVMAPVVIAAVVTEYAGLRLLLRDDAGSPVPDAATLEGVDPPRFALAALGVMTAGFVAASALGVPLVAVAVPVALVLAAHAHRRGRLTLGEAARSAHVSLGVLVLALALLARALRDLPVAAELLDRLSAAAVPGAWSGVVLLVVVGAVVAAAANNLPATLLLVPAVAAGGDLAVLAVLVGVNLGANLTPVGSLANLLWSWSLERHGIPAPTRDRARLALLLGPPQLLLCATVLWWWGGAVL
jgi:arsenical pump membrane protein